MVKSKIAFWLFQNSVKIPKTIQEDEQGTKKKAFVKNLAWRKSFAQFLKRKRYHSPAVTSASQQQQIHQHQQQQTSPGNNNNNDFAPTDPVPESRNGISALGQQQTKVLDISTGTEDLLLTSQTGESIKMITTTMSPVPVENITTGQFYASFSYLMGMLQIWLKCMKVSAILFNV